MIKVRENTKLRTALIVLMLAVAVASALIGNWVTVLVALGFVAISLFAPKARAHT